MDCDGAKANTGSLIMKLAVVQRRNDSDVDQGGSNGGRQEMGGALLT